MMRLLFRYSLYVAAIFLFCVPSPSASQPPSGVSPSETLYALFGFGDDGKRPILKKKQQEFARSKFAAAGGETRLVLFTEGEGCRQCGKAERFLRELADLSPLLVLETLSYSEEAERARQLGIERVPGIALLGPGGRETGIRYYGIPLGFEFETFVEAVVNTGSEVTGLQPETIASLSLVKKPVIITVFVTEH